MLVLTHRGLDPDLGADFPSESSFEAFTNHLSRGYGIEFDPCPVANGIVVSHDKTLGRLTKGADERQLATMTQEEVIQVPLPSGRLCTLDELLEEIAKAPAQVNALHLKGDRQTPEFLEALILCLKRHPSAIPKLMVFDVRRETAEYLRKSLPELALAPSVAHDYDIQR